MSAALRVEHPSLPYGYADVWLADNGLVVAHRPGSSTLYDVWASVEAFTTLAHHPASLVAGNLRSLDEALTAAAQVSA